MAQAALTIGTHIYPKGGPGAEIRATIPVSPGELLKVFVGGRGRGSEGGWNGEAQAERTAVAAAAHRTRSPRQRTYIRRQVQRRAVTAW